MDVMKFLLYVMLCVTSFFVFSQDIQTVPETVNEHRVVHLKGSPYERGYQHGSLLKEDVHTNIQNFLRNPKLQQHPRFKNFGSHVDEMKKHIPAVIIEELKGLADGAEASFDDIFLLNLFPEMFHCSGITAAKDATVDGSLYHVRVLDYRVGMGLQSTAAMMVCTPDEGYSYVNISYAGFIGCVTGMNSKHISLGEVGGNGYDYLDGLPMAFLMKLALERCETLAQVAQFFKTCPRTGEYYYILSDGKTSEALSVYATNSQIHFISPGSHYALLAPGNLPEHYGPDGLNDKFFLKDYHLKHDPFHCELYSDKENLIGLFFSQLKDTLTVTGFAAPARYDPIVEEIKEHYGHIDKSSLVQILLKPGVSHDSNLHTVIFRPESLDFWVAHASEDGKPAYVQPFKSFNLNNLLK